MCMLMYVFGRVVSKGLMCTCPVVESIQIHFVVNLYFTAMLLYTSSLYFTGNHCTFYPTTFIGELLLLCKCIFSSKTYDQLMKYDAYLCNKQLNSI